MRIEISREVESVVNGISACVTVMAVVYFLIVVLWAGSNDNNLEIEKLRAETCYTEFKWSEISKTNNEVVSYCTKGEAQ